MKKIFTLLFILICFLNKAQTLHKAYNINYSNAGDAALNTLTYGGGLYFCYVEDSTMFPTGKQSIVLQKNDLNGNFLWKKTYRLNPSTFIQPSKIVSLGSNIFIGGNYGVGGFLTSVDTSAGNVNYFNYYPPFGTSTQLQIKDIAVLNGTQIVAVGNASSSITGINMYVMRANAATGVTITQGLNFYTNEMANGVCCLNNSLYIVGSNAGFPFITKLRVNGSFYIPVGTRLYNGGISTGSNFQKIVGNNSTMVVMGVANSAVYKNILVRIDTNITPSNAALIARITMSNSIQFHNMVLDGNNTLVCGYFNSMYGVARFDANLNFLATNTYSTFGQASQIQYINNNTYFTIGQGFTGSNVKLMKGTNNAVTVCSFSQAPVLNIITITNSVLTTSISVNNTVTALSPLTYSGVVTPTTTCLSTDVKVLGANDAPTKLLSGSNQYEIVSEEYDINDVSVFDLTGKLILNKTNLQQNSFKVDLNSQSKGLYFIKIKLDNNQFKTFKVVNQ